MTSLGLCPADSLDVSHADQVSCGSTLGRLLWHVRPRAQPEAPPLSNRTLASLGGGGLKRSSVLGPTPNDEIRISGWSRR